VFERMDVKFAVFAELDSVMKPGAILATRIAVLLGRLLGRCRLHAMEYLRQWRGCQGPGACRESTAHHPLVATPNPLGAASTATPSHPRGAIRWREGLLLVPPRHDGSLRSLLPAILTMRPTWLRS
jgi:hypothetical protein